MPNKPKEIREYTRWLAEQRKVDPAALSERYYEAVIHKAHTDWINSHFWQRLLTNLQEYNAQYVVTTGYPLLLSPDPPQILLKPYESFLDKTIRKNVLNNSLWPEPPTDGWLVPSNWFSAIHDVLRTLVVVKYLDGVTFLANKLQALSSECGLTPQVFFEAREEGYYAVHLYVHIHCEVPRVTWDTERLPISLEIQITTQLQEVIRKLLHKYYERRRVTAKAASPAEASKWQWQYETDEFATNYLGHILHYVEGMIMEVRERQQKEERGATS